MDNAEKFKITLGQNVKRPIKAKAANATKEGPKSLPFVPGEKIAKPKAVKRVLLKRKCNPRVPYYDETDKNALKVCLLTISEFLNYKLTKLVYLHIDYIVW